MRVSKWFMLKHFVRQIGAVLRSLGNHSVSWDIETKSITYEPEVPVSVEADLPVYIPKLLRTKEAQDQIAECRKLEDILKYPSWAGRPPHD